MNELISSIGFFILLVAIIVGGLVILFPSFFQPIVRKIFGEISELSKSEYSYLKSLEPYLESKNLQNFWEDKFYIPLDTELQRVEKTYNIPPKYYIVKKLRNDITEEEFQNLTNAEKIDSSKGTTYNSLEGALHDAHDNATVIIGAPGSGKTVSLRNLAIKYAKKRLKRDTDKTPLFVNLGYYTGFTETGRIQSFENFLEEFFSSNQGFQQYLSNGQWRKLLAESRCIVFLDGIDELPRNPGEYEERSTAVEFFVRSWPNTQFILSCRELDYKRDLTFQQILIKPFDSHHVRKFIKKYIPQYGLFRQIFKQILDSKSIYELCTNPFYLTLICYFSKFEERIPETKAQLFDFLADRFIKREVEKQKFESEFDYRKQFMDTISHLAFYLAIERMVTTINLNDYEKITANLPDAQARKKIIRSAIKGELLEYNEINGNIRFIHNRFQEYFSSYYILGKYKSPNFKFPDNFFTNIWWRETILFIAGLEDKVDDFIELMLAYRDSFSHKHLLIQKWLKLEITITAFESMFSNIGFFSKIGFDNSELYVRVRNELISRYKAGTTFEKAKILTSFRFDSSFEVVQLLNTALRDESPWISERAFFILNEGRLRFQMTPRGIWIEFWRFFIEGRMFETIIPIIQGARNSRLLLLFLPLFFVLLILNIFAMVAVGYVFYKYGYFLLYKMEYSFTYQCLACLVSMALNTLVVLYFLLNSNYPILRRFLSTAPLALFSYLLVMYLPSGIFKFTAMGFGYLFGYIYFAYFRRPGEKYFSIGVVTSFYAGISVVVLFVQRNYLPDILKPFIPFTIDQEVINSILERTRIPINGSFENIITYILALLLLILVLAIGGTIINEVRILDKINESRNIVDRAMSDKKVIAATKSDVPSRNKYMPLVKVLLSLFDFLSLLWAQKTLLRHVNKRLTSKLDMTEEEKMDFWDFVAGQIRNVPLRDSVYQILDDESQKYRRQIEK